MSHKTLPWTVARRLCFHYDAWICGGAADRSLSAEDLEKVRDIDIMVPFAKWEEAAGMLSDAARAGLALPNGLSMFGGMRFSLAGDDHVPAIQADIWPGTLDQMFAMPRLTMVWSPKLNVYWIRA